MTLGDDLRRFRASPEVPRLAVALFATAAVMLAALASTSLPNPDATVHSSAVEQPLYKGLVDGSSPSAPTPDCLRYSVKRGKWLQAIVMHRDHTGREWHECYYGSVQIRAGDANL